MSVKSEDENSNIVRKQLVEEETELDDHALKVEKFVKTELNLKPYLQVCTSMWPQKAKLIQGWIGNLASVTTCSIF